MKRKTQKIDTLDLEIALIQKFDPRANLIVPNVSWGIWRPGPGPLHECDILILSKKHFATEIEIKVTTSDLLKDSEKWHGHYHNLIRRFFYAVPAKIKDIALEHIPERAGLITAEWKIYNEGMFDEWKKLILREERSCKINRYALKWDDDEAYQLARLGAMRILNLKKKIKELKNGK